MTPRFVFHPAARDELRDARDRYEAQRPGLGEELGAIVGATLDRIRDHPELYPEVMPGVRRAVLARFPFALIYRGRPTDPARLEILAVFHHRRDPIVWRRRPTV